MFAAFLAAMVLIAVAFTGCGKDSDNKGGGGANSVGTLPRPCIPIRRALPCCS